MFDNLAERLQSVFAGLTKKGALNEKQVDEALREVRLALLEADVNFKVVKNFIARVKDRAIGENILKSLTPGQQVVKIVHEELTSLMGSAQSKLSMSPNPPTVIMIAGLQGSGKTTTTAKLALHLRKTGRQPLMIAADIYRPAAIDQLVALGEEINIPVFSLGAKQNPLKIAVGGLEEAERTGRDVVLLDTAGRLHIDEEMMKELQDIKKKLKPHQVLLVVDAMTGQDAVNVAEMFNSEVGIDGIILTKLDGDARGGAALSVYHITGKPIKFMTVGEKLDAIEPFHPERMASRILGMGDVLSLIEKAEQAVSQEQAKELEEKIMSADFGLDDFLVQLDQIRDMGPLSQLVKMLPGVSTKALAGMDFDEKRVERIRAIIKSMTVKERRRPDIINGSRRERIAKGSGTSVNDVNQLLKQFTQTKKMLKQFSSGKNSGRMKKLKFPFM